MVIGYGGAWWHLVPTSRLSPTQAAIESLMDLLQHCTAIHSIPLQLSKVLQNAQKSVEPFESLINCAIMF